MAFFRFRDIEIAGMASAVPAKKRSIDELRETVSEESISLFSQKTGASALPEADELQTASDLGYVAAKALVSHKQIEAEEIGAVVFVSKTPDYRSPATACVLHGRLGLSKDCIAFDVNHGSTGFVYGLQVICSLLDSIEKRFGLLVVGDTTSKQLPDHDPLRFLFGDGASAVLVKKLEGAQPVVVETLSFSDKYKAMMVPGGGFRPLSREAEATIFNNAHGIPVPGIKVDLNEMSDFIKENVPAAVAGFLQKVNSVLVNYDLLAFNQTDVSVLSFLAGRLGTAVEKMVVNFSRYGDTCGSSIPLIITGNHGFSSNRDVHILACAYGEGLSLGITDFVINANDILPVIESDDVFEDGAVSHVFQQ